MGKSPYFPSLNHPLLLSLHHVSLPPHSLILAHRCCIVSQDKVIGFKRHQQPVSRVVNCAEATEHKEPVLTAHKQLALAAFQRLLLMTGLEELIIQPGSSHPENCLDTPISYTAPLIPHNVLPCIQRSKHQLEGDAAC